MSTSEKLTFELRPLDLNTQRSEIMTLIRKGLRESFEESHLIWKHLENPFGVSFALGTFDGEKLVGLRLFMKWVFEGPNLEKVHAIRPVDTVTDPDYRGKGIFSTLTLHGINHEKSNYNLIFNTPNLNSRSGYIKMGWQVLEEPVKIHVAWILPGKKAKIKEKQNQLQDFKPRHWSTQKSGAFLHWRYQSPEYKVFSSLDEKSALIYRKTSIKSFPFLVICEWLGDNEQWLGILRAIASKEKTPLVYYLSNRKKLKGLIHLPYKNQTPFIVFRDDEKQIIKDIQFSLGDLEAKL